MGTFKFKIDGKWLKIPTVQGKKGEKGDKPIAGLDYFTEEDKEVFKQAVVEDSKTEINEHTETKKIELDNYTTELETNLKTELDTYTVTKETELDTHKTALETEMSTTKDNLVQEIETEINTLTEEKQTEINNNATAKINEFNEKAESYEKRIANTEENIDYIVPKNVSESDNNTNFIEDAIDYKIFEIEIEGNSIQNGIATIDNPTEKETIKDEIYISKSGGQLFDLSTITKGKFMNIDGTFTWNVNSFCSDYIPVIPSSIVNLIDASYDTRLIEFDENREYVTGTSINSGAFRTMQLNTRTHYIIISDNTINDTYKTMIVSSGYMNLTDYIYTGNIVKKIDLGANLVNKLSTYATDTINIDKIGNIVLNKKVERLIVTGNEKITMGSGTYTNSDGSINHMFNIPVPSNRRYRLDRYVECNFFYYQSPFNVIRYNNSIVQFNESFQLITNKYETLEDFVQFLKEKYEEGNPLYIDYMITPAEIELGNIGQLNTTEGINYMHVDTNINTNINVQYAVDIKKYTDNSINELKAMIVANATEEV